MRAFVTKYCFILPKMEENEIDKDCYKLVLTVSVDNLHRLLHVALEMFKVNVYIWRSKLFLSQLFEI